MSFHSPSPFLRFIANVARSMGLATSALPAAPTAQPVPTAGPLVPAPQPAQRVSLPFVQNQANLAAYPPESPLLRHMSAAELLAPHQELIARINRALGLNDTQVRAVVQPMLERFARYAHLIPASESDHHCEPGGLLQHSLETAFYAIQQTEAMVFALEEPPDRRRKIEPLWRFAAFTGGLVHDIGKALESVHARSPGGASEWQPTTEPISKWLDENGLEAFELTWNPDRKLRSHEKFGAILAVEILGPDGVQHLESVPGAGVFSALLDALAMSRDRKSTLATIISKADGLSVEQDYEALRARPSMRDAHQRLAYRVMRLAMLRIREGYWRPNQPGQPIWCAVDGVFAVVPGFYNGILESAQAINEAGIPHHSSRIRAELARAGLIEADAQGEPSLTTLALPTPTAGVTSNEVAIRILRPDLLLGDVPPPPPIHIRPHQGLMDPPEAPKHPRAAKRDAPKPKDEQGDLFTVQAEPEAKPAADASGDLPETPSIPAPAPSDPDRDQASEWFESQQAAGEIMRAILDANLSTDGPIQVYRLDGRCLIETVGLVTSIGFSLREIIDALADRWLDHVAPDGTTRYAFEHKVAGRSRKVFALNAEASSYAFKYAPELFDPSSRRAAMSLANTAAPAPKRGRKT
ncbi:hypothetical protein C7S18_23495 (plasmid) [Ahniella affigens]|uniref:HD/PDEase domain-containing protein n=1 Tax=Ahniella affigens TaxID=2021234 RepID=A0A2P1PZJ0_9GAMM|nr:hypothetical protein C7S18_23495 [Ahniella affigens]